MKILFFGDIVGKIGRRAMAQILPEYKNEYKPDLVIANGENLAHGTGITMDTVQEVLDAGIDFLTTGNHVGAKKGWEDVMTQFENKIIRPANYPEGLGGKGYASLKVGDKKVYIINLNGRVFMHENFEDPFREFDKLQELLKIDKNDIVLVDFHAEATSEKNCFGWYVNGRASAMVGTHTHVPTSDNKVLAGGTAYVSDVGMIGARDSIIGVEMEGPTQMFLTQINKKFEIPEEGEVQVNAVLIEVDDKTGRARKIERVDKEIEF